MFLFHSTSQSLSYVDIANAIVVVHAFLLLAMELYSNKLNVNLHFDI